MSKLVSILMPVYNAEKWINESIQSVLNQTYSNWELIIVDDGSVDNSFEIAKIYKEKDTRVIIYKQDNFGACAARNKAFELSKGDYIQYLDADDLLSENKIEKQIQTVQAFDYKDAIVTCTWEKFHKKIVDTSSPIRFIDKSYKEPINWLVDSWARGEHGVVMMWLIPRHLIEKAGKWNEELKVNQDGEFFCRVLIETSQILYVESARVYYRVDNPDSVSQLKISEDKAQSHLNSFILYEQHLTNYLNLKKVKLSLIYNYLKYLYIYDRHIPSLSSVAWQRIRNLGFSNVNKLAAKKYHFIIHLLGFSNYLRVIRLKIALQKLVK